MIKYEQDYLSMCKHILEHGNMQYNKRTGTNCLTIPEYTLEYDVGAGEVPLLTTKQCFPISAVAEIIGYLRRYEWADQFADIGSKTWYDNANKTQAWLDNEHRLGDNHIGQVYGAALEDWELPELFDKLMRHEDDRGLMINFWRPHKFKYGCLRPCMYSHTFTITDGVVNMVSMSRSVDISLGLPFNSMQCYFLLKLVSHATGLKAGKVKHVMTNVHIYEEHIDGIKEQLSRTPLDINPTIDIKSWVESFDDVVAYNKHAREYVNIEDYEHLGKINFNMVA